MSLLDYSEQSIKQCKIYGHFVADYRVILLPGGTLRPVVQVEAKLWEQAVGEGQPIFSGPFSKTRKDLRWQCCPGICRSSTWP